MSADTDFTEFTAVDGASDPGAFVRFLDAISELRDVVTLKSRLRARLAPRPGEQVLDVGCGTGLDARWAAERVAPGGAVVGVDASQAMIDVSRQRSQGTGLPVQFHQADAGSLPFPGGSFDACTIDRVLCHMEEPERAVSEIFRVLRPAGRLVGFDVDFEATLVHGPQPALARRMVDVGADSYRSGRVGRRLASILTDAGFSLVDLATHGILLPYWLCLALFAGPVAEALRSGRLDAAEADAWWAALEAAEKDGRLVAAVQGFVFSARKP